MDALQPAAPGAEEWYYRSLADALRARLSAEGGAWLGEELERLVEEVFGAEG